MNSPSQTPHATPSVVPGATPPAIPFRARTLILWRHGRTQWNLEHRFQGHSDIPLDEVGLLQASESAKVLSGLDPDLIVASDLMRARDTAQALADVVGLDVVIDPDLRETNGGAWEGRIAGELRGEYPTFIRWSADEDVRPDGGGETRGEVADRVVRAIERAMDLLPQGSTLVVVAHGGALRAGMGRILGLPQQHWGALGGLNNCAWSVLVERNTAGVLSASGEGGGAGDSGAVRRWRLQEYNGWSLPEPALGDDA
jgi:glucosyl-3-phosphoglycerate phosphatase